jgi:hypothetical protein
MKYNNAVQENFSDIVIFNFWYLYVTLHITWIMHQFSPSLPKSSKRVKMFLLQLRTKKFLLKLFLEFDTNYYSGLFATTRVKDN